MAIVSVRALWLTATPATPNEQKPVSATIILIDLILFPTPILPACRTLANLAHIASRNCTLKMAALSESAIATEWIGLSGCFDKSIAELPGEQGAWFFLLKPFSQTMLLKKIDSLFT